MFFDIDKCDIFLYDCELKIVTYADNILYICEPSMKFILDFCYLAVPRATFGHCRRSSLTNPMLITAFETYSTQSSPEIS